MFVSFDLFVCLFVCFTEGFVCMFVSFDLFVCLFVSLKVLCVCL